MLNRVARDRVNHHSHHDKPKLHAVLSGRGVTQVSSYLSEANVRGNAEGIIVCTSREVTGAPLRLLRMIARSSR
jgi:hypothetical protein